MVLLLRGGLDTNYLNKNRKAMQVKAICPKHKNKATDSPRTTKLPLEIRKKLKELD